MSMMEQINEQNDIVSTQTLLGKRESDTQIRPKLSIRKCHGCRKPGHFARDNPSCFWKMKKSEEYQKRKMGEAEYLRKSNKRSKPEYEPESSQEEDDKEDKDKAEGNVKKKQRKKSFFQ